MISVSRLNTLQFAEELCTGCGMCVEVCPHGVFAPNAHSVRVVRPDDCMECGACQKNCVLGAIEVESGVGCAAAMTLAAIRGQKEVRCG